MLRLLVVLSLVLPVAVATANDPALAPIKEKLAKRIPEFPNDTLRKSTMLPGWYEVDHNMQMIYISPDGKYLVTGDVIEIETRTNLTTAWREQASLKKLSTVSEQSMIVIGPTDAKRTVTVFTDVDCPYCARLHEDVPALNKHGVKVRYLLFPRGGPGSDTYKKSVSVWCAADRAKAIGVAKAGGKIEAKDCRNPVDAHYKLGIELRVNGTPTIYLDDGKILGGYVAADQLLAILKLKQPLKTSDARKP